MFAPELLEDVQPAQTAPKKPGFGQKFLSAMEQMIPGMERFGVSLMSPEDKASFYDRKAQLEQVKMVKAKEEQRQLEVEQAVQTQKDQFDRLQALREAESVGKNAKQSLEFAKELYKRQQEAKEMVPAADLLGALKADPQVVEAMKGKDISISDVPEWMELLSGGPIKMGDPGTPQRKNALLAEYFKAQRGLRPSLEQEELAELQGYTSASTLNALISRGTTTTVTPGGGLGPTQVMGISF